MKDESFLNFVCDQMSEIKDLRSKRMFSGWGIYSGNKFFAIVSEGTIFFKTNKETSQKYKDFGMKPFAPSRDQVLKNYYEVPADILENREELLIWAEESASI